MIEIYLPTLDVNSNEGTVNSWMVPDCSLVQKEQPLAEIETAKVLLELPAPEGGWLLQEVAAGENFAEGQRLALLFESLEALENYQKNHSKPSTSKITSPANYRATKKAEALAQKLGVDLNRIDAPGLITEKIVRAHHQVSTPELPEPLKPAHETQRIILIGAGLGATQVIDILEGNVEQTVVGIVDDDESKWGQEVEDIPVVGGKDRLRELFERNSFDAAIVAISTSVKVRALFRHFCQEASIPLANAIDPSAKIGRKVTMGSGNVICAHCHLGTRVSMGDNNFLSAYSSFDHHSILGNDISTGPGCLSSGCVELKDRVRLGTGVFMEPHVVLGEAVQVASGAVILTSVSDFHSIKTKVITTQIVPPRGKS